MEFDLGLDTTDSYTENIKSKDDSTSNSEKESINTFLKELFSSKELIIDINKDLLEDLEKFIEEKFINIAMNDEIFPPEEQALIIRWLDNQKYAFWDLIQKPYLNNKIIISVTGRFSAGKSSFLNSVFNINLPVDVEATTAIPTYITYYDKLHKGITNWFKSDGNYMLVNSIFGNKVMKTEFLNNLKKENLKNFPIPISVLLNYFVISMKNSILKNKVIIDTPGIDPSDKKGFDKDEKITQDSLALSNIVFWVMDIDDGDLSSISKEFLEKNINEEQQLVIIINKTDKKPPSEVNKVVEKVKQTIKKSNIKTNNVKFFRFSKNDPNHIQSIIDYIQNIPVEKTTPLIIDIIDAYLKIARENIVNKIIETKRNIDFENEYIEDFLKLNTLNNPEFESQLHNIRVKYKIEDRFKDTAKHNRTLDNTFKKILDMLELDVPFIGEDKYCFPYNQWDLFVDRLNELASSASSFSFDIGFELGLSYHRKLLAEDNKLKELEELEELINNSINEFENLKNELKKLL